MKARILFDDLGGRFRAGEIGEVLYNDSVKYEYFIRLPGEIVTPFGSGPRCYYFYSDEVEILKEHQ